MYIVCVYIYYILYIYILYYIIYIYYIYIIYLNLNINSNNMYITKSNIQKKYKYISVNINA